MIIISAACRLKVTIMGAEYENASAILCFLC